MEKPAVPGRPHLVHDFINTVTYFLRYVRAPWKGELRLLSQRFLEITNLKSPITDNKFRKEAGPRYFLSVICDRLFSIFDERDTQRNRSSSGGRINSRAEPDA